jgi:bifunctional non-homologous end joining protein LigD
MLAQKDGARVRLISRHGTDTPTGSPLVRALLALRSPAFVLDGEVAAFDAQLVARFEWLRRRPHGQVATPPIFMAFDCLRLGGDGLRAEPLRVRRQHVEHALDDAPAELLPVRRLVDHGLKAWQEVLDRGWEGLVAKDPESRYVAGRSLRWLKVKQPKYREGERGWEPRPVVRAI